MRRNRHTATATATAQGNGSATAPVDTAPVSDAVSATATAAPAPVSAPVAPPAPDKRAEHRALEKAVRDAAGRIVATIAQNGMPLALADAVFGHARKTAGRDARTGGTADKQTATIRTARSMLADAGGCPVVSAMIDDAETAFRLPGCTISGGHTAGAVAGALVGIVDTARTIRAALQGK